MPWILHQKHLSCIPENVKMRTLLLLCFLLFMIPGISQENINIKREGFSLVYPSTWTIDTADPDYDPDALFTLESPDGNCMAMFIIMDMFIENDEMLNAQVKEFKSQLIKKPTSETPFTAWGNLTGKGMVLKGKLMGVFPGTVRIFTWTDKERSMVVIEQHFDDDFIKLREDYKLIESSFKFH